MKTLRFTVPLGAAAIMSATPASAVVFTVTPDFFGQIGVGPVAPDVIGVPPPFDITRPVTDTSGTHFSQTGAVLETGPGGTFLFQNTHVGTGTSYGYAATRLLVRVTNDGRIAQDLRLDSQITPGHLAARDAGGSSINARGSFDFSIQRDTGCVECTFPKLFEMFATIHTNGLGFGSSRNFYSLNGLHRTRAGNALAYDWGATNIGIDLGTFAVGETRNYIYDLTTTAQIFAPGMGLLANRCDALQVSFGDPRSRGGNGGGSSVASKSARSVRPGPLPDPTGCDVPRVNPLIGLPFGAYDLPFSIVPGTDPLPDQPPAPRPVDYSTAVPEPAALGLLAFGISALTTRRRQRT